MRIDLNLSKEPFRNRTAFWLIVTGSYVVVLFSLVFVLARAGAVGADTAALMDETAKQTAVIAELEATIAEMKAAEGRALFTDADRRALDDARVLLERKSVAWSRLLGDLEPYVPERAKLTGIQIIGFEGSGASLVVRLQISGTGKDIDQMTTFLSRLDGSGGRFASDPVENGPVTDSNDFEFIIDVLYRPTVAPQAVEEAQAMAAEVSGVRSDG
ncbi:MAG: hypothetical protein IPF53_02110 [Blastocatellia bacterium]|nr:hypothetical protein [Blastocatellia bacterium]